MKPEGVGCAGCEDWALPLGGPQSPQGLREEVRQDLTSALRTDGRGCSSRIREAREQPLQVINVQGRGGSETCLDSRFSLRTEPDRHAQSFAAISPSWSLSLSAQYPLVNLST